jgi:integrase
MERINNERVINSKTKKAEKGTVTVRKRGNSFEARIRLELKNKMKGVDCNPRLSRSAQTEALARQRLAELIIEKYLVKQNHELVQKNIFSDDCEENLKNFNEYRNAKEDINLHNGISSTISFANFAVMWLNYKKDHINPTTGKKISPKTVETYAYTLKGHIQKDFSKYTVAEVTKEVVEEYINDLRKVYPRAAKDTFLMIRQVLKYAKKKNLIKEIPEFELEFSKKKRSRKTKLVYLPADRQLIWLDILEKDGRDFCKLFATLLQTGMRPEEGCGLLLSNILFDKDMIYVGNAHKDIVIYDYNFNIIRHEYVDGDLKTDESYREIPLRPRLKKMLQEIYDERKALREKNHEKFNPSKEYVFLNTKGEPYLPERLDKKLKSIIKKYKLEHMTVYGLRHSFATFMSEYGMDKEVLREIMGHADFETTDFYYIFISDKRKKEEFNKACNNSLNETKSEEKRFTRRKIKAPTKVSA